MKRLVKILTVGTLAAALAFVATPKAEAFGGWAIGAGALGGFAVGTAVGATVVAHSAPYYYAYPAPVYAPAPVVVAPPVCAAPVVVARAYPYYYHPRLRVGFGWGRGYHYRRW